MAVIVTGAVAIKSLTALTIELVYVQMRHFLGLTKLLRRIITFESTLIVDDLLQLDLKNESFNRQ